MNDINEPNYPNDYVYPQDVDHGTSAAGVPVIVGTGGLTLRDYFAAKALQGLFTQAELTDPETAVLCYMMADAMLTEREKVQNNGRSIS